MALGIFITYYFLQIITITYRITMQCSGFSFGKIYQLKFAVQAVSINSDYCSANQLTGFYMRVILAW